MAATTNTEEPVRGSESKEKLKREKKQSSDFSGEGAWINAHHDPVASLYTFSSCLGIMVYIIEGVMLCIVQI